MPTYRRPGLGRDGEGGRSGVWYLINASTETLRAVTAQQSRHYNALPLQQIDADLRDPRRLRSNLHRSSVNLRTTQHYDPGTPTSRSPSTLAHLSPTSTLSSSPHPPRNPLDPPHAGRTRGTPTSNPGKTSYSATPP